METAKRSGFCEKIILDTTVATHFLTNDDDDDDDGDDDDDTLFFERPLPFLYYFFRECSLVLLLLLSSHTRAHTSSFSSLLRASHIFIIDTTPPLHSRCYEYVIV